MIFRSIQSSSQILAAGLIATAGTFLGQGAAQAELYYPCSSVNNAFTTGSNCQTLNTAGALGGTVNNPILITTTANGVNPGFSQVTITPNPAGAGTGFQVNGSTQIQSATAGDRAFASFNANGTQVGWTNPGGIYTGLTVNGTQTTLSGGTVGVTSTQLVLNGSNATFSNTATGAPITVTGVADGVNPFDAVNFRQLQAVSTGVASIAAMSNIPALDANKKFGIGIGYGNFQGNSALAVGVNGRLAPSLTAKLSVGAGLSYGATSVGTGVSYSW